MFVAACSPISPVEPKEKQVSHERSRRDKFKLEQTSAGPGASSSLIYSQDLVCKAASVFQGQRGDAGAARQARR